MDNTIFAQSIARIRFKETKMLDKTKLEALVESAGFADSLRMLQDSEYAEYLSKPSYEEGLKESLQSLYKEMYKLTPVKEIVDVLAVRYDGHNIKSLIKGKFSGIETYNILVDSGTIPVESLKVMIKEENFRDIPMTLRKYVEKAIESYKNHQDPQEIDIIIDKGVYEYMLEIALNSKLDYLVKITKTMIDIINIKSFIRIKLQDKDREFLQKIFIRGGKIDIDLFINNLNDSLDNFAGKIAHTDHYKWVKEGIEEFVKTKDIGKLEKSSDNFMINYLKNAKLVSFGPEPIVAYIIAKETEIKAVRIVLTGKKNKVLPDIIRERLRDLYV